jgi:hypothetical protein
MRRGGLLAILFCAFLWATVAHVAPASSNAIITAAGADGCSQRNDPQSTGDSDRQWDARPHTNASITESVWKSPLVHAELASARCNDAFAATRNAELPAPRRSRPAPGHLLRIPLLI